MKHLFWKPWLFPVLVNVCVDAKSVSPLTLQDVSLVFHSTKMSSKSKSHQMSITLIKATRFLVQQRLPVVSCCEPSWQIRPGVPEVLPLLSANRLSSPRGYGTFASQAKALKFSILLKQTPRKRRICRFDLTVFSDGCATWQPKNLLGFFHGNSKAAVRNSAEMEGRPNQASGGDSSDIAHAIIVW